MKKAAVRLLRAVPARLTVSVAARLTSAPARPLADSPRGSVAMAGRRRLAVFIGRLLGRRPAASGEIVRLLALKVAAAALDALGPASSRLADGGRPRP